jgi:hypothetical protein
MDVLESVRTTFSRLETSFPEIDLISSFTAMSRTPASALEEARIMSISSRLHGCPDAGLIFINIFNFVSERYTGDECYHGQ